MEKGRATKSHKKGSIIAIEGVGDCPAVEPLLLLSPTHSHRRQQLPHLVDFCLGCGRSVAPCPAASCSSHSIVGEDVAKLPQFPSVPPAGETSSSSSSSMILCAECSTSSRIPLRVCLVDTSNGENEKQKHQDEDSAFFARAQLRRYLQRLAQARGESDGMVAALIAVCSLILSTKAADTMAKLQSSILDTSNNDGDNDDADADDDVIGECWALLLPCNEDDDNDASNTTATASTFLRQGPLAFGRFVQSIRQRCLFWVDATHPVAAYVEKLLPTLSEEDMDVALKSLKPLVDWAFRNDGKVLAKDGQSDVAVPAEKILRYRRVARLAQVMSSQGGGDIMEDGDKMPSPRDELDRHHQVILSEGACLEHSCNPNCVVVCRQGDDDNELLVVQASMSPVGVELLALCDIEEGERLTVSRMDGGGGLDLPVDSRASTLRQIMGSNFSCRCPRCRYERLDRSSKQQIILGDTRDGNENQVFYWKEIKALGDLAMQQGRHEDAEEFYSLVLKTKPDNGDALHARAASYLERGLYCKSQQLWKEAHNIGSTHKEISLAATKQKAYGFSTRTKEHGNEAPTSVSTRNYKVTTLMEGRCFITDRDSPILSPHDDLVTLCTQMTVDRLPRLLAQATNFGGPVSAVVFVGRYKSIEEEIEEVAAAWESSEILQKYADIHLVFDGNKPWFIGAETDEAHERDPYPINLLRQESIIRAETEWVFVVEGDIVTVPSAHELIRSSWDEMLNEEKRLLAAGANSSPPGVAFVVPLYDAPTKDPNAIFFESPLAERVPKTKDALTAAVARGSVKRMSDVYVSHSGLDYQGWEKRRDSTFASYEWSTGVEPYHISRKDNLPPFDPLYAGMTNDKTSQLQDMGRAGYIFALHPQIYAVNFGSEGIGESWIAPSEQSYWRFDFVSYMLEVFFKDYKRRMKNGA